MTGSRLGRRSFLRSLAGVAAGGIAAPVFVANLFGQSATGNSLAVAAIGVGGRGSGIGREAAAIGGRMLACCDVLRSNAQKFAAGINKAGGQCKAYADYREMLDKEKNIDAITIGTPDHWHVKIAVDAMKAGKHVYCEKPLTLTFEEGELVSAAVKKYGKVFQVGTQQRSEYNRCFIKAAAIAQSGRLGKKLRATSSVGKAASRVKDKEKPFGPFKPQEPPGDLNWDLWLGPAPRAAFTAERIGWNFRWWFEYSGGQVTDWGVHHTDIAFWALAGKDGQAVAAEGTGKPMGVPLAKSRDFLLGRIAPNDMVNAYNVALEFDVDIRLSTGNIIKLISGPNELIIEGENGKIRVNRGGLKGKPAEDVDADPKAFQEIEEWMNKLYGGPVPRGRHPHMQNFFDCIRSGGRPVANVDDHVRAVNACHMANLAILAGKKISYDPKKKKFDHPDATALMRRARRAQYDILV